MISSEFEKKYLSKLNNSQLEATKSVEGPVLLLAVPGSGKTTVLVARLGYMIAVCGINPSNILTLTYTVSSTKDMGDRFTRLFGDALGAQVEFRTINGVCAKIIQQYGYKIEKEPFELITDEKRSGKILSDIFYGETGEYPTESDIKAVKTLISYCKNMMISDDEIEEIGLRERLPLLVIYNKYNDYLKENRLMDYDDQMRYALNILKKDIELLTSLQDKYKYICVDEAQDTSKIQHKIINLLASKNENLFMVGDEDQSIYGFRAAYPEALLDFEKNHTNAKVLVMNQNYRSNAKIVEAADSFIQSNMQRHAKTMLATKSAESDIYYIQMSSRSSQYNYLTKVARNHKNQTAILYRDNESILPLVDILDREHIRYRIRNAEMAFFTNRVVLDVLAFLKLSLNPNDTDSFLRIYYKCQTYLKKNQAYELVRISKEKNVQVLDAFAFSNSLDGMRKKNCKALRTHLLNMRDEDPNRAINRIMNFIGYGEYLEKSDIDSNKVFILKMLAKNENTINGYINRLNYLNRLFQENNPDYTSDLILSTIHSSKGLEYDEVYLMDVCNGILPVKDVGKYNSVVTQEVKNFEEERRLFYVAMTRAKHRLSIFTFKNEPSKFIKELRHEAETNESQNITNEAKPFTKQKKTQATTRPYQTTTKISVDIPSEITEGLRVYHMKYGKGSISQVIPKGNGKEDFYILFDRDNTERKFEYPTAFKLLVRILQC